MNKIQLVSVIAGLVVISGLVAGSLSLLRLVNPGELLASVKKVSSQVYNIYTRKAEPYLYVNAPTYRLLPLNKEDFNPKKIIQSLTGTPSSKVSGVSPTTENSLVNIFCSQRMGKLKKTITGSGVLINKDGTVLTNAHVAQFPLVADSNESVVCIARIGSPAQTVLSVKTVFISPEWLQTNAKYINSGGAPETGQSDYALLKVSYADNRALNMFPSPIAQSTGPVGSTVNAVSYPADILGTKGVNTALYVQREQLKIADQYMFTGQSVGSQADIIQTSDSSIGQRGSSGGALTDENSNLIGIITTTTNGSRSDKKQIRGISINHIHNELLKYQTGGLLGVAQDGSAKVLRDFNSTLRPTLTSNVLSYLSF